MWKKLPLCAAVLALYACSLQPKVRYPTGLSQRAPINVAIRTADSPYLPVQKPPVPMEANRFYVETNVTSVMNVVAQWAQSSGLVLHWYSSTDYPVTDRIRSIQASTLDVALESMRVALTGVEHPLVFTLQDGYLVVRDAGDQSAKLEEPVLASHEVPLHQLPERPHKVSIVLSRSDTLPGFRRDA